MFKSKFPVMRRAVGRELTDEPSPQDLVARKKQGSDGGEGVGTASGDADASFKSFIAKRKKQLAMGQRR
jgi:hypothetical protein